MRHQMVIQYYIDRGPGWTVATNDLGQVIHYADGHWLPPTHCTGFLRSDRTAYRRACLNVGAWIAGVRL